MLAVKAKEMERLCFALPRQLTSWSLQIAIARQSSSLPRTKLQQLIGGQQSCWLFSAKSNKTLLISHIKQWTRKQIKWFVVGILFDYQLQLSSSWMMMMLFYLQLLVRSQSGLRSQWIKCAFRTRALWPEDNVNWFWRDMEKMVRKLELDLSYPPFLRNLMDPLSPEANGVAKLMKLNELVRFEYFLVWIASFQSARYLMSMCP